MNWCKPDCERREEINLPRAGLTPGCVFKVEGGEVWRRLDRMSMCPLDKRWGVIERMAREKRERR